ncbi:RfbD [Desulfamplus magnetovallimortis]|uniref:dTDP-4-dehydrorhamnose reductase n=1 Tax=Desulfamplus magnetovallimortis TaxID=1246637 RepID=A0A1W1HKF1_9BACT|nr:dTDP-4-dehydrorhamnose reductase [Desulfamplus magnetovallimortis]SLM32997.1 RfbD [Desulfamplus magnetovallimortis]
MKILLCGSNGQLGCDCIRVFEKEHKVMPFDLPEMDITDKQNVADLMQKTSPDLVINCAAYTQVDKCETNGDAAWAVNVEGAANLAEECRKLGALLFHVSTDYVFDGTKEPPLSYSETDPVNPLSVYGKTKLEGEKRIAEITEHHIIVRTAWLYGIGGQNFLKTMLRVALSDPERTIKVVNDQFGSPTWTLRLALQMERLIKIQGQGIYHATSEGYCSWYELAINFLKLMEVPFNIVPCATSEYPTPARRPANSILENVRLKRSDNNKMTGWRHGLEQFVSRYRQELLDEFTK